MKIRLNELYKVPFRQDEEDVVWYRTLNKSIFVSDSVGWVIGSAQVLRSLEQGRRWENLFSESKSLPFSDAIDLFSCDGEVCHIISVNSMIGSRYCLTRDGGRSWEEKIFGKEVFLTNVFFVNSTFGWLAGDLFDEANNQLAMFFTGNGGKDWIRMKTNIAVVPINLMYFDCDHGLLLGEDLDENETGACTSLFRTFDGGNNWTRIKSFDFLALGFQVVDKESFAVFGENGIVMTTSDEGANWERVVCAEGVNINAAHFTSGKSGVVVGDEGYIGFFRNNRVETIESNTKDNFIGVYLSDESGGYLFAAKAIYDFSIVD